MALRCPRCRGSGKVAVSEVKPCPACIGGRVGRRPFAGWRPPYPPIRLPIDYQPHPWNVCLLCGGSGGIPATTTEPCPTCKGTGIIAAEEHATASGTTAEDTAMPQWTRQFVHHYIQYVECDACRGSGIRETPCSACAGSGWEPYLPDEQTLVLCCQHCGGSGFTKSQCVDCKGTGKIRGTK